MTDRELLEFAAKAAGKSVISGSQESDKGIFTTLGWWNPLTDDGDALRLAVKLCMQVECSKGWQHASVYGYGFSIGEEIYSEANAGDPNAATRRAIVRAAAAIGREQP